LNQADPIFQSGGVLAGQTAFNPFGDFRVPIPSNQATVDFARVHPKDEDISKIATVDGTVYTTSLFELPPVASVRIRWSVSPRNAEGDSRSAKRGGDIVGNSPVPPANGEEDPTLSTLKPSFHLQPEQCDSRFYSLEFTGGARFESS